MLVTKLISLVSLLLAVQAAPSNNSYPAAVHLNKAPLSNKTVPNVVDLSPRKPPAKMRHCMAGRFRHMKDQESIDTVAALLQRKVANNQKLIGGGVLPSLRNLWLSNYLWHVPAEGWSHCIKGCLAPAASQGFDSAICRITHTPLTNEFASGYTQQSAEEWQCDAEWQCLQVSTLLPNWEGAFARYLTRNVEAKRPDWEDLWNLDDADKDWARWNRFNHSGEPGGERKWRADMLLDEMTGQFEIGNRTATGEGEMSLDGLYGINIKPVKSTPGLLNFLNKMMGGETSKPFKSLSGLSNLLQKIGVGMGGETKKPAKSTPGLLDLLDKIREAES